VGLRVIDAGQMIAGPLSATLLADFGADVIKLEDPNGGDAMRTRPPEKDGHSLWWKVIGRNKRNVTLNLRTAPGQDLFRRLAATADVVIENFRPGTFDRWGLDYESLAEANERLILARVSGYGQDGPYRSRPGYGTIAEAFTGIPSFSGFPDKPPSFFAFPIADSVAATFAAMAIAFAVYERDRSEQQRGQEIDVSLFEPLFRLAEVQGIGYDQLGIVPERRGNRSSTDSPRNAYRTADDRLVALSASTQRSFRTLVIAMGLDELADDPRFANGFLRQENADVLDEILGVWFRDHAADEALGLFEEAGVAAGPVYDIAEIFSDPHYAARKTLVSVADDELGTLMMPNAVPRLSRTPGRVRHAGRALGADNVEVFVDGLGLGVDELDRLRAEGIV
jgi:crotonobetainyl-CoA:carnitine CoA-transferase CaiB-like acyl-CoA transferase